MTFHTHLHTHRSERQRCTGYDVTVDEDDYTSYLSFVLYYHGVFGGET